MRRVKFDDLEFSGKGKKLAFLEGTVFTGEAATCENGYRIDLKTLADGHEDGPCLKWSPAGKLIAQGIVRDPYGPVGPWHEWGEDGRLLRETIYDALGNKIIVREFDEAGNMAHEEKTPPTRLMRDPETGEERPAPWL